MSSSPDHGRDYEIETQTIEEALENGDYEVVEHLIIGVLAAHVEMERTGREADEIEVVVNNTSTGMVSTSRVPAHSAPPTLSKASVDAAMPKFKLTGEKDNVGNSCVICLEEINVGEEVREMPCKHVFHWGCIDKWLGTSRSCPVCRYVMPVDKEEDVDGSDENGRRVRRRRVRTVLCLMLEVASGDGSSETESFSITFSWTEESDSSVRVSS